MPKSFAFKKEGCTGGRQCLFCSELAPEYDTTFETD